MTSRLDQHHEDIDFRILRLLEENPQMTQRELARALGISLGGANYCVKALIAKGLVKIQNFQNNRDKLAYAYLLTPKGIAQKAGLTASFLKRKMQEFEGLKAEIQSLQRDLRQLDPPGSGSDSSADNTHA